MGWEASRPLTLAASVGDPDTTTNNLDETLLFLSLSLSLVNLSSISFSSLDRTKPRILRSLETKGWKNSKRQRDLK